ncbi:Enamine deaminase RidA, house cleaning of reactive enamine intermediates, YjgF/YER057c/UK114 family [Duganella sacchari]|uniref:Enamine deaminase RidA, house cleaning of reactive enamine intermediates, YjgF/YER057c/UK114 family n=1 Tax=Duganella sacchari TaxID=551987 RepID=A0A1M7I5E8_9BURK|nr:RidA family protein [Duganella sacchari]SHM35925.1 Enamine deaminase RidA, house cleaning of reactive enamine intermediates, YjgF/YER057c/UK114 family [Duganella sacchari]
MSNNNLPFSKWRRAGGLVFLSGELPLGPDGAMPSAIEAQTRLTLQRIAATLDGAGLALRDVVQVTVYLTHPEDFAAFNAVYQQHFTAPYPVRTTVVAPLVLPGARVEITVIAADSADAQPHSEVASR